MSPTGLASTVFCDVLETQFPQSCVSFLGSRLHSLLCSTTSPSAKLMRFQYPLPTVKPQGSHTTHMCFPHILGLCFQHSTVTQKNPHRNTHVDTSGDIPTKLRCDSQWLFDSHKHHSPWPSLYSLCSDTFNHPTVHILMRIPWRPLPTFHCDMPGISIPFMTITHDAYKCPHPTVISNSTSCPLSSVLTHDFFGQFSPVTLQRAQCPHSTLMFHDFHRADCNVTSEVSF